MDPSSIGALNPTFAIGPGGELVPLTPGSTAKVTTIMAHAIWTALLPGKDVIHPPCAMTI